MKLWDKIVKTYEHWDNVLGTVLGMPNYEKYLEHVRTHHPEKKPMSRKEFYKAFQEGKDGKINRCC